MALTNIQGCNQANKTSLASTGEPIQAPNYMYGITKYVFAVARHVNCLHVAGQRLCWPQLLYRKLCVPKTPRTHNSIDGPALVAPPRHFHLQGRHASRCSFATAFSQTEHCQSLHHSGLRVHGLVSEIAQIHSCFIPEGILVSFT